MRVDSAACGIVANCADVFNRELIHTLNYQLYIALSGRLVLGELTRRVAAGWLVLPFQGVGNIFFTLLK
ncbi:MAG: hypothetical protein LBP87_12435 [Planctomycetaceae bacterium]|nr:hypothetical protein [Planctomycetaceae bacterium]